MDKVVLICGYKTTGKDKLFRILNFPHEEHFPLMVLRRKNIENKLSLLSAFRWSKFALADELKFEVANSYKKELRHKLLNISDSEKEIILSEIGKSPRDLWINHGKIRRDQNINYWCQIVWNKIKLQNIFRSMITDFRFENEYSFFHFSTRKLITIRYFRKDVPIKNDPSERSLDNFLTDYLVFPKENFEEEFAAALKIFPQYADFAYSEII